MVRLFRGCRSLISSIKTNKKWWMYEWRTHSSAIRRMNEMADEDIITHKCYPQLIKCLLRKYIVKNVYPTIQGDVI